MARSKWWSAILKKIAVLNPPKNLKRNKRLLKLCREIPNYTCFPRLPWPKGDKRNFLFPQQHFQSCHLLFSAARRCRAACWTVDSQNDGRKSAVWKIGFRSLVRNEQDIKTWKNWTKMSTMVWGSCTKPCVSNSWIEFSALDPSRRISICLKWFVQTQISQPNQKFQAFGFELEKQQFTKYQLSRFSESCFTQGQWWFFVWWQFVAHWCESF